MFNDQDRTHFLFQNIKFIYTYNLSCNLESNEHLNFSPGLPEIARVYRALYRRFNEVQVNV